MSRPINIAITMAVSDPNGISLSQTPGGAGDLTITGALASGGVATMDYARHVLITSAGNDAARTYTITGTDRYGNAMTETINPGPNVGTVTGSKNFLTVTQVAIDAAAVGANEVGTADSLDSKWIPLNHHVPEFNVGINCAVSSDINATYGAETTISNVQADGFVEDDAAVVVHPTITGKTAAFQAQQVIPIVAIRFNVTSYVAGTITASLIQPTF